MAASTLSDLRNKVNKEKLKLDALKFKPVRYILATTQSLTEANVTEFRDTLSPYCKADDDILDVIAIEKLLALHESVINKHYKLWITSTTVLQRILNAGIYNRTESYRENLIQKCRTFVQPKTFTKARKVLADYHNCLISGPPGVGKTTLADMLCLEYLAKGFDLIVASEDVAEADQLYLKGKKQVIVYDDFLGRTDFHERLGKNEDSRLVEFIQRIERSPDHRFILTTREYILRAARQRHARLDIKDLDVIKFTLRMNQYDELQRGTILYQHLAFAEDIDHPEIEELVRDRRYRDIISHPNYTPRHITDALSDIQRRRRVARQDGSS